MLLHKATGPDAIGEYRVTYKTPGCNVLTVACSGLRSRSAADSEAERRNAMQVMRENVLQADATARGQRGVYPGLKTK